MVQDFFIIFPIHCALVTAFQFYKLTKGLNNVYFMSGANFPYSCETEFCIVNIMVYAMIYVMPYNINYLLCQLLVGLCVLLFGKMNKVHFKSSH